MGQPPNQVAPDRFREDSPRKAENVASGPLTHPLRPHSVKSVEQPWLVAEQEIEGLYNAIDDKKWLEGVLSKFSDEALSAHKIDRPNSASFRHAASASLYAVTVIFPVRIKLDAPSIRETFIGSGKGLFGSIVAQSWGTLYYNDINDLVNGSDFECNFLAVYANINFIRGGQTYATYHGGGTPLAGIGGGSGEWT